jgi:hypothetical protein
MRRGEERRGEVEEIAFDERNMSCHFLTITEF